MKRFMPIIILLAVIGAGYWWFTRPSLATSEPAGLFGSGSIEAETVAIVAELGGRVTALKVDEGDEVTAGQVLIELDKADLLAQRVQLQATLATAQDNLTLVSAPPQPEDIATAEAQLAQAKVTRDGARLTWQRIQAVLNNPLELEAKITQAQAGVTEAENNLELARVNLKRLEIQAEAAGRNQTTRMGGNEGIVQGEVTQYQVEAGRIRVKMAEVALAGAKQQVEHLIKLRRQPLSLMAEANAARAAYDQAEATVAAAAANLDAVKAGPAPEDITVAQAQVLEAEAALDIVDVKLGKQILTAPRAGLISRKLVDPGELAAPGNVLLELSDIDTVDLTVYIPETQVGQIEVGQKAQVYVDAYDNESFEGVVTFIAHEAEFTPKNVQTLEERVNLVFAVKITLANPDHRLKPGMPADAEILPVLVTKPTAAPTLTALPQATATPTPTPFKAAPSPTATAPASLEEPAATYAEVLSVGLNVRSGPGINHAVISTLARGDTVSVREVDPTTGWLQVELPEVEKIGWISGLPQYVSLTTGPSKIEPTPTATPTPAPMEANRPVRAEIISPALGVHSGPDGDKTLIAILAKDDTVTVIDVDAGSGWLRVELADGATRGWIPGDPAYVSFQPEQ